MIQEHPLFKRVSHFIETERLFDGIKHVDVALSGGADSVCLLAILSATNHNFTLRAHHIRHGLRPDDIHDANVAQNVAQKLGVEFIKTTLEWNDGIPACDIENSARDARYHALFEAIAPFPNCAIALAHHGDENLETALWRLSRGCGLEGLGMSARRTVENVELVRPLLAVSKDEIYAFLKDENIEWAEDPTNQSEHYRRNRIRHHILPALKQESMSADCLYRSLLNLRGDAEALSNFAQTFVATHSGPADDCFIPWCDWNALNRYAKAQILRHAARTVCLGHCPTAKFVETAIACLDARKQTRKEAENGIIRISWSHGGISICHKIEKIIESPAEILLSIPCFDQKIRDFCSLSAWYSIPESPLKNTPSCLHIDAAVGPVCIRSASEFDTFQTTRGTPCTRREAFSAMDIPERWKSQWPVLCAGSTPLWIIGGMRTADALPSRPGSRTLTICVQNALIHA